MKNILPIIFIFFILPGIIYSQNDIASQQVDSYIHEKMEEYNIPGIALAVVRKNEIIKEAYYGYSNLDHGVPVSNKTVFPIASMDKQFTATCIMMLYEQDKLKLTDPVTLYLNPVPETWNPIQIKHLLTHTSGLPDEVPEFYFDRYLNSYTTNELFSNIQKQTLLFVPGENYRYSDAGYLILQLIVEKVSGMSYSEFLTKSILHPIGLNSTFTIYPQRIIPNRTTSYFQKLDGENIINTWRYIDFGPLYNDIGSTIKDFAKYDQAISSHKLLKRATYEMMWQPVVLNDGRPLSNLVHGKSLSWGDASYGFGWVLRKFRNHRIVYHSGYTGTSITRFPDDELSVILFTNLTGPFNPDEMARYIGGIYFPESSIKHLEVTEDPRPASTFVLKEQLTQISRGKYDPTLFTNNFALTLDAAIPAFSNRLQKLGVLQNLEYLNSDFEKESATVFYKAHHVNGILFYQVRYTKEGKIDFISAER